MLKVARLLLRRFVNVTITFHFCICFVIPRCIMLCNIMTEYIVTVIFYYYCLVLFCSSRSQMNNRFDFVSEYLLYLRNFLFLCFFSFDYCLFFFLLFLFLFSFLLIVVFCSCFLSISISCSSIFYFLYFLLSFLKGFFLQPPSFPQFLTHPSPNCSFPYTYLSASSLSLL